MFSRSFSCGFSKLVWQMMKPSPFHMTVAAPLILTWYFGHDVDEQQKSERNVPVISNGISALTGNMKPSWTIMVMIWTISSAWSTSSYIVSLSLTKMILAMRTMISVMLMTILRTTLKPDQQFCRTEEVKCKFFWVTRKGCIRSWIWSWPELCPRQTYQCWHLHVFDVKSDMPTVKQCITWVFSRNFWCWIKGGRTDDHISHEFWWIFVSFDIFFWSKLWVKNWWKC